MARRSVAHVLSDFRWVLLGVAGAAAAVLSWIGLGQYQPDASIGDRIYNTLKMFVFSAPVGPGLPPALEVARLLAPLVAGYATLSALARVFSDRFQQMRIPLMRDHVVLCGLGYAGTVFLRKLREAGVRVVVIELDAANPNIEVCRSLRIPVVIGDAQLERTLRAAGAHRASRLLAVCPNDAVNAEIIAVARRLVADRTRGELRCLARITDPDLCALLRVQEVNLPANSASSLDYFNTDELSARQWLDEFPLDPAHPHIVVDRLDALGRWLVLHAAWAWHDQHGGAEQLWVSVVDDDAGARLETLLQQCPDLERVCRFRTSAQTPHAIRRMLAAAVAEGAPPITRAYVSAYRDEEAIESALVLWHELEHQLGGVPMVVALSRSHGVARLIDDGRTAGELRNIEVFRALDGTCTIELVQGGSYERIAEAIHRRWRNERLAEGGEAPTWRELDESRRESNRDQARDIVTKLRRIGCTIGPLRDWSAARFEFTTEEVEDLAVAEHDRWVAERLRSGWTPGPRDPARRTTPYLVPFDELPEDIADRDRSAVLGIPAALASAGLQINRVSPLTGKPTV
ncbi:NAD-binding protein [Mycolicibacterium sp.]|uniref:NAD-binding protein n=1 Tax=Mycolicibacterium sp. TaxID=2320850 RepID=UPI003D1411A4